MGIDSHGCALLAFYDRQHRSGQVAMAPEIRARSRRGRVDALRANLPRLCLIGQRPSA
jgi:LDH2 family malate/lactate/ureidoglycolate dehydrogenase